MKKLFDKALATVLGLGLIGMLNPTYAVAIEVPKGTIEHAFKNTSVEFHDDSSILVQDESGDYKVEIIRDDSLYRVVLITNLNENVVSYITLYKDTGEITSSYSSESINVKDVEEKSIPSDRSKTKYSTVYISWRQIKNVAGSAPNAAAIIGGILTITGAGGIAGGVASIVGGALGFLSGVIPDQTNHGLKVTIATTKYYRNGNHVPYRTTKTISGIGTY